MGVWGGGGGVGSVKVSSTERSHSPIGCLRSQLSLYFGWPGDVCFEDKWKVVTNWSSSKYRLQLRCSAPPQKVKKNKKPIIITAGMERAKERDTYSVHSDKVAPLVAPKVTARAQCLQTTCSVPTCYLFFSVPFKIISPGPPQSLPELTLGFQPAPL